MKKWPIPAGVVRCLTILRQAGYQAYPVGGCVRDLLLGRTPGDFDLCTSARPERVLSLFEGAIPTGIRHGTVTVPTESGPVEITAFRRESGYADGRHPDTVVFDVELTEDLARRDFTINAMALGSLGEVIDPFNGQTDLAQKCIRCVGEPDRRFAEDGLRMLRAVRFSAQLDFAISPDVLKAIRRNAFRMARVSKERIKAEMEKILLSPRPERMEALIDLGLLAHVWPVRGCPKLKMLADVPPERIARWRAFCTYAEFPIGLLPVERDLRQAILHPEREAVRRLALTGGDLVALGLRGAEIGRVQRALAAHVLAHPEDNLREKLMALIGQET